MKPSYVLLLGLLVPQAVTAQAVATLKDVWTDPITNVTLAAQEVPESLYSYRPVPTVRTFGQLVAHVAGSQNYLCSIVLGGPERAEDEFEKQVMTKAALVAALKASTEYCAKAYAIPDVASRQHVQLFGQDRTKLFVLGTNAAHNDEHYGNIVTYMRMNGMVPPSSKPRQ